MSTLKTNTIKNTDDVEMYLAKAWVNFNGTGTVAIRAAGNVSSITDNGTADYTINFTNPMSDANYSPVGMARFGGAGDLFAMCVVNIVSNIASPLTTTTARIRTFYASGAGGLNDADYVNVAFFR